MTTATVLFAVRMMAWSASFLTGSKLPVPADIRVARGAVHLLGFNMRLVGKLEAKDFADDFLDPRVALRALAGNMGGACHERLGLKR